MEELGTDITESTCINLAQEELLETATQFANDGYYVNPGEEKDLVNKIKK